MCSAAPSTPCITAIWTPRDAARSALALNEIRFVPSKDPPHRSRVPHATAFQRFALTALAINGLDGYRLSEAELVRDGRSYTSDTLRQLHAAGWAPRQLFFILGADAFAEIATWREYPAVLDAGPLRRDRPARHGN